MSFWQAAEAELGLLELQCLRSGMRGNEDKSKCQAPARFNICRKRSSNAFGGVFDNPARFTNTNMMGNVLELGSLSSARQLSTRGGGANMETK